MIPVSADIETYAKELGVSLFGVADVSNISDEFALPEGLRNRLPNAISMGKRLIGDVLEDIRDAPTQLYYHHYRQLNFFLDRVALLVSSRIQDLGFHALPIPASQVIDWPKQRGHLSHKKIGRLAGLGWIGRNNLLVNSDFGARFRLVSVLTDMPFEPSKPMEADCGACRECLSVCPAGAIKDRREDFDHLACFEKLKEFRRSGIVPQFICGICVKACPGTSPSSRSG
jgi:epoxyqueuosine reductase QueG